MSYLTDLIDLITQPNFLDYDKQHQILAELEPALRSTDPEERRGGLDVVERFSSRRDIFADVDRSIARLRTLGDQPAQGASDIDTFASQDQSEARLSGETTHLEPPKSPTPSGEKPTQEPTARSERRDAPPALADHSWVVADQSGAIRGQRRTTPKPPDLLGHLWKSTLVSGALTVILSLVVLVWPGETLAVIGLLVSLYLLIASIGQAFFGFAMRRATIGSVLLFISGAACLMFAVLATVSGIRWLAACLALALILRGGAQTTAAASDRNLPGRSFYIFLGAISLIAGIFLFFWFFWRLEALTVLALVAGLSLLVIGVCEIVSSFWIRKAAGQRLASP